MTTLALVLLLAQADVAARNDQAQQLAADGRAEEAAAIWRELLQRNTKFFPAAFNLGFFHYSRQEHPQAEPFLTQAAALNPADFNSRFLLGQVKSALGHRDAALREWRTALAMQPAHARLIAIMAVEYSQGGYFGEAVSAAKRALALRPDDLDSYLLAIKSCQDAQDAAGPVLAEKAARQFPASARANFEYAWFLQRGGRAADSVTFLQKAMALDPSYEEPFFFYGTVLLDEGKPAAAIEPLQTALARRPNYTAASISLGRALMELERFEEAIRVLNEAARLAPRQPQPPLLLSRLYYRQGDEAKARAAKELSLRLRRENASALEPAQSRPFR